MLLIKSILFTFLIKVTKRMLETNEEQNERNDRKRNNQEQVSLKYQH